MAQSTISLGFASNANVWNETALGATAEQIKNGSTAIHMLVLDNTANAAATYFRMWNAASGSVTVGTTAPDEIIMVPLGVKITIAEVGGKTFGTALTVAACTTAGTAGNSSPASNFNASVVYV